MTSTSPASGWYVYGVVPADAEPRHFEGAAGVEPSAPIGLVAAGDLAAVVSRVSLDEFDEAGLRHNLESAEWLEDKARAHDDGLARLVGGTPLVPPRVRT